MRLQVTAPRLNTSTIRASGLRETVARVGEDVAVGNDGGLVAKSGAKLDAARVSEGHRTADFGEERVDGFDVDAVVLDTAGLGPTWSNMRTGGGLGWPWQRRRRDARGREGRRRNSCPSQRRLRGAESFNRGEQVANNVCRGLRHDFEIFLSETTQVCGPSPVKRRISVRAAWLRPGPRQGG